VKQIEFYFYEIVVNPLSHTVDPVYSEQNGAAKSGYSLKTGIHYKRI
jgi:hypothetical protein